MTNILKRIKSKPALVLGLVQSSLALAISFGADLSGEQVGQILAVTSAIVALTTQALLPSIEPEGEPEGEPEPDGE